MTERLTKSEAKKRIEKYCAWQERCAMEVRSKLYSLGLTTDEVEETIADLILSNYLHEERFARAFCGGKFRQKHWGRLKIIRELKQRQIGERNIQLGLKEIEENAYEEKLSKLITKALRTYSYEKNPFILEQKVAFSLISKGYESDLVWDFIKNRDR
jgi:regulatory protein